MFIGTRSATSAPLSAAYGHVYICTTYIHMYVHIQAFNSTNKLFIIINTDFLSLTHTHWQAKDMVPHSALGSFFSFFLTHTHSLTQAKDIVPHSAGAKACKNGNGGSFRGNGTVLCRMCSLIECVLYIHIEYVL